MNTKLKKILKDLGKTPNAEPEIYAILDGDSETMRTDVIKYVLESQEMSIGDFKKRELQTLYGKIFHQITDFKYDSGVYKSTDATKELEPLSFEEEDVLASLFAKGRDYDIENVDDINKYEEQIDNFLFGKSGKGGACNLDIKTLSDWEKMLVRKQLGEEAIEGIKTSNGDELKN